MKLPHLLTSRRMVAPAIVAGLLVSSLLPAKFCFYGPTMRGVVMFFVQWPSSRLHELGSRLHQKPADLTDKNADDLAALLLQLEGQLRQKDSEIRRLREENAQLTGLRRALGDSYNYVPARVIGRSPDPAASTISISAGARDGVRNGMIVVDGPNLVGRIVQTQRASADVQPISSLGLTLRATVGDGGVPVLFKAAGPDLLVSLQATLSVRASVGDDVRLTSEQRVDPWPSVAQHMLVGRVTSVTPDADDPLGQEIEVRPLVPLYHLSEITVIVPTGSDRGEEGGDAP